MLENKVMLSVSMSFVKLKKKETIWARSRKSQNLCIIKSKKLLK